MTDYERGFRDGVEEAAALCEEPVATGLSAMRGAHIVAKKIRALVHSAPPAEETRRPPHEVAPRIGPGVVRAPPRESAAPAPPPPEHRCGVASCPVCYPAPADEGACPECGGRGWTFWNESKPWCERCLGSGRSPSTGGGG